MDKDQKEALKGLHTIMADLRQKQELFRMMDGISGLGGIEAVQSQSEIKSIFINQLLNMLDAVVSQIDEAAARLEAGGQ